MLKELVKVANKLDYLGLKREAELIDNLIRRVAQQEQVNIKYLLDDDGYMKVATDIINSIKEVREDLNLYELIKGSLDQEALDKYNERVYHTDAWVNDLLSRIGQRTGTGWKIVDEPKLLASISGHFVIAPEDPWDGKIEPPIGKASVSYNSDRKIFVINIVELI